MSETADMEFGHTTVLFTHRCVTEDYGRGAMLAIIARQGCTQCHLFAFSLMESGLLLHMLALFNCTVCSSISLLACER